MARVATCKDCGARFKVPDDTKATRAKCKKCGGVVEIPAAGGAPSKAGPSARKRRAPEKATVGTAPAKGKRARSSESSSPGRRSGGRRGAAAGRSSGRRGAKGGDKKGNPAGIIFGIVMILAFVGGGVWWFAIRDDGTSAPPAAEGDVATSTTDERPGGTGAAADTPAGGAETPATQAEGVADLDAATDPDLAGVEKAAPQSATAKAAASEEKPTEPLPTRIDFEPVPAVPGTEDQLEEWTRMVAELYITDGGATGRRRTRLRKALEDVDPVDSIPAYLNALIGLDLEDRSGVRQAFALIRDWQERVAYTPMFSFPGDDNRMDMETQNLRVQVVNLWRTWWVDDRKAGTDPNSLAEYRLKVEERLRKRAER